MSDIPFFEETGAKAPEIAEIGRKAKCTKVIIYLGDILFWPDFEPIISKKEVDRGQLPHIHCTASKPIVEHVIDVLRWGYESISENCFELFYIFLGSHDAFSARICDSSLWI